MVHLYLDEDVDVLLALLLAHRGILATTALENKMLRKDDDEHFELAIQLDAIMVTHNRGDYESLFASFTEQGKAFPGLIILKQINVYDLAQRLFRFFREHKDIKNQLWYL